MKSTIKQSYAKTNLANGDVALTYRYITLTNIMVWILGAFLIGAISANTRYYLLFDTIELTNIFFSLLGFVGVPVWIAGYYIYIKLQREHIFVTPNVGVRFGRNTLPFKDISTIGVYQRGNGGYVFADTQGTRVKISKMIEKATANSLDYEIRQLSGCSWS